MKAFELYVNPQNSACNIKDNVESEMKNAICIYNDLGIYPFTSAPALCDKLNELYDEVNRLKKENADVVCTKNIISDKVKAYQEVMMAYNIKSSDELDWLLDKAFKEYPSLLDDLKKKHLKEYL